MYGLNLKHAQGECCPRCKAPYQGNKTFFAFIDPNFHSGVVTLWGSECCTACSSNMQKWGTQRRTEIATAYGITMLKLEPVHLCLTIWSQWCPRSYERYGLKKRVSLNEFTQTYMTKGIHHAS